MIDYLERDGRWTLTSTALRFDFDAAHNRFSIGLPAAPACIQNAFALARFDSKLLSTSSLRVADVSRQIIQGAHGQATQLLVEFQPEAGIGLTLRASLYPSHPFLALSLAVANRSAQTLRLRQLVPLHAAPNDGGAIGLGGQPLSFFKNGYQSWSYAGLRRADQRDVDTRLGSLMRPLHFNLTTPISRRRGVFWSEMFGALIDPDLRQAIVAGQIGAADQFAQVGADTRQGQAALTLTCDLDGVPLAPGQSITSEEMFVQLIDLHAGDPFAGYFEAVARQMAPRAPAMPQAGWCSWYCYFGRVREDDVIANLRFADEWRDLAPINLIQIDDGYQAKTGDWLSTNGKFPRGMKWLSDQIRASGRTPGLWLAPFIATRSAQVARQHPDWLIRSEHDRPVAAAKNWGENAYGLDMTHPGAQDYVRRAVDAITHEWGYPYLKLDFLVAAALPGRRHDPTRTRAQALRRGLELIRETAGDDVFLLGCGCPLGPAIGVVDAMRVGPDIAPDEPTWTPRFKGVSRILQNEADWPCERNAVRNVLTRSGLHRRWWLNDPDPLIVRPARHMSEVEVQSWASVVGLSGGLLLLGDSLPALPIQRRRYITALMPPLGDNALALDLFERERPELYVLRQDRDWGSGVVAGAFNWGERPHRKMIDLARLGLDASRPHHAYEFWSGAYRRAEDGQIDLGELPAHGCAVVAIRPVLDRPHLVATTFHLTMGGEVSKFEIGNSGIAIEVELKRRATGEIWIGGCAMREARVGGQPVGIRQSAAGVLALSLEVDGAAQIEIDLPTSNL
jgi:alpha-galactosidase